MSLFQSSDQSCMEFCRENIQESPWEWTMAGPTAFGIPDQHQPYHPMNMGREVTHAQVHLQPLSRTPVTMTNAHNQTIWWNEIKMYVN